MSVIGGVEVIGTLVPKNGKFPVVMAENVGFEDGSNLKDKIEDMKTASVNKLSVVRNTTDHKKRTGMVEYPFQEINKSNMMEVRLVRSGDLVFCSINAYVEIPMAGKFDLSDIKIPEGYIPTNQARAYFKNGYWNFDTVGSIHLSSSVSAEMDRSVSLCWLTDDPMPEEG